MYSKLQISVSALFLSMTACSASSSDGGTGGNGSGTGGTTSTSGGSPGAGGSTGGALTGAGGSTGGASAGGNGPGSSGGSSGSNGSGGKTTTGMGGGSPTGGASNGGKVGSGGAGGGSPSAGGSTSGGASSGGKAGTGGSLGSGGSGNPTGGAVGMGGSGTSASFKCDNLSLAPSTTGVAKPSGSAGGLKVLDWAGFKGAVSFTFDDNTPSQMSNYNALKATGAHFTWFVVGSWLTSGSNISSYKATIADGQEMANHTYSHQSAGSQSDLQQAETFITSNFGVTANSMAAPNCDGSWASVAPNVLFQNRGPCSKGAATVGPRDSTSPFALPAYLPDSGESGSSLTGSFVSGKWRIFVIHGFDSQGGTYQPVPIGNVTSSMSDAVKNGYWAEGISNVGAYWQGQKLISASATTSATWTLPSKFPKNMCVRITTTGGTVTQMGQSVPWDDHGYYQISLDAGAVTIQ